MGGTTRSAALLSVEPEDMSGASRGRALMPLVTVGCFQCIAWSDQSENISGGRGWTLYVTRRLCGVSSTMDWVEVEMSAKASAERLRLLPTISTRRQRISDQR